ncbi:MAG TPA: beta-L-arabinofuranosidase domain-containing protein [Streptosporangiaceae bacterium]|nr:beta-L-arabinofuranosidase domain-containing protein [Streptosporangiaceae bacterium]
MSDAAELRGPVRPTASADVVHRPVAGPGTRLESGLLHDWQQRSSDVSLPLAVTQMEAAGNLGNLRLAISGGDPALYRGPAFMDSDIYKTLEAVSWELSRNTGSPGDRALAAFAAEATDLLERAQEPDGYLNSYIQVTGKPRYAQLASSHELYCAGHLIQAAVAAHRTATVLDAAALEGESAPDFKVTADALFAVATRFADHLVDHFLGHEGNDGHPIIETALAELYRETGHEPYLRLASQFLEQRGYGHIGDSGFGSRYLQDHLPVRENPTEVGHAVRALYLEAGIADVAAETADRGLLAASITRWADMVATKTALTGGNGSRHSGEAFGDAFELPPDRAYNETCAAIASFQWSWRLLLATGESRYADLMERLIYNGFGASVSADGQRFFYVNPLQRRIDHFENDLPGRRREWFSCACCPPNIMRARASLQHYLATVAGDVVYLHQFTGSAIAAQLPAGAVDLEVQTGYPWTGRVEITVRSAPEAEIGLAVRVPAWGPGAALSIGGQPADATAQGGYLVVRRRWQPGDVLVLELDLSPRLSYPSRHIDALRGTAAVERGPLVYCFEQADHGQVSIEDLAVTGSGLGEQPAAPELGESVAVSVPAAHQPPAPAEAYRGRPDAALAGGLPATAMGVAIPYFQWDNRDGGPMRVWLPLRDPSEGGAAPDADTEPDRVPRPRQIP